MSACMRQAKLLEQQQAAWQDKLPVIYAENGFAVSEDPEQRLYDGFIGERDRGLCQQVREDDPERLADYQGKFADERLEELLFRYRARNFPQTLNVAEQQRWQDFCRLRLSDTMAGAPNTLAEFDRAVAEQWSASGPRQQEFCNTGRHADGSRMPRRITERGRTGGAHWERAGAFAPRTRRRGSYRAAW